jgi:hypothetical protein
MTSVQFSFNAYEVPEPLRFPELCCDNGMSGEKHGTKRWVLKVGCGGKIT